jgi:cobalamin biosynthesis Mg chelatase CobN
MRTRASLAAIATACVGASGVAYADGGPAAVYNDFAQDGVLSCNHSRADLLAALRSGSLNEYGDPLTLARLKLAVRKQLAGGCRRTTASGPGSAASPSAAGGGRSSSGIQKPGSQRSARHQGRSRGSGSKSASPREAARRQVASSGASNASFFAGRGLIIGLLVAALALGGWLTKHALAARD